MRAKQVIFSFIILFLVILLIPLFLPSSFLAYNRMLLDVTPTGVLQITGAAPQVLNIYADDVLCTNIPTQNNIDKPISDNDCTVNSVEITAEIYDENGDCEQMDDAGTGDIIAYICIPDLTGSPEYCDQSNANFTLTEDLWTLDVDDGLVCNLTANLGWSFYERWGNWSINVTVQSPSPESLYNNSNGTFYRTPHQEFIYPPDDPVTHPCSQGSQVDLGAVNVNEYNNGTGCSGTMAGKCFLKNVGNIRLNITWNATNFTLQGGGPGDPDIDVRYDNYAIDKDATHTDGAEVYMSDDYITQVEFPTDSDRVERCGGSGGVDCDNDEDGNTYAAHTSKARFDVYWHIKVPFGVRGGTYNNQIWANQHKHEDGW